MACVNVFSYISMSIECPIEVLYVDQTMDSIESCESQLPVLLDCCVKCCLYDWTRIDKEVRTRVNKYQKNYP